MNKTVKNVKISPELFSAFKSFVNHTNVTRLHRCIHRMMHDYIMSDPEMDKEHVRDVVYQMGELFELLEAIQDNEAGVEVSGELEKVVP